MGLLGSHVSVSGGAEKAVARAIDFGCDAFQIFVKSPNQWRNKPRSEAEIEAFRAAREEAGLPVVAHAGYLINLASPKPEVREKSHASLIDELERCEALGVPGLVMHPGAPQDDGRDVGVDRVAKGLDAVFEALGSSSVKVLLENTAGQGSTLGIDVAELERIRGASDHADRLGLCLDTCHAFAAGVDLGDFDAYERFVGEVADGPGLDVVGAWHLNDSKFALGEHRDRHASIGEGMIPMAAFARLVHDERFADVPMILETPYGDDGEGHVRDLATLRAL